MTNKNTKGCNEKKVAFIMCGNDYQQMDECIFYLQRLHIPEGYEIEILTVTEAQSMAAGYNSGMNKSNAKYKVYLHQDVMVINQKFISDMLEVFKCSEEIGLMGCIGCRRLPENAYVISGWDTGKVIHNGGFREVEGYQKGICQVEAVDGLIMATQYDIPWREDLFTGWDFYDISQCFEFRRVGKKVVVPYQETYWCNHDNHASKLKEYNKYREIFIKEYSDIHCFGMENVIDDSILELEDLQIYIEGVLNGFLNAGNEQSFCRIFESSQNRGYAHLREYEEIYRIHIAEKHENSKNFWKRGMTAEQLKSKLRRGKHLLKRIEHLKELSEQVFLELYQEYTIYAIAILCKSYCLKRVWVAEQLLVFYKRKNKAEYEFLTKVKEELVNEYLLEKTNYLKYIVKGNSSKEKILLISENLDCTAEQFYGVCKQLSRLYHVNLVVKEYEEDWKRSFAEMGVTIIQTKQAVQFMWDLGKYVFEEFVGVIAVGQSAVDYVRLYDATDIPVFWVLEEYTKVKNNYGNNVHFRDIQGLSTCSEFMKS